ncbi:sigma-54-dependent Fis family transcriptional regulator, partial [Chloroflexota bacterium]
LDVTPMAMEALMVHDWPGNIRELKNLIERAVLFCDDPSLDLPQLPNEIVEIINERKMKKKKP